jgi:predicted phosphoribosyltransferase
MRFQDRRQAGRTLATLLLARGDERPVVVAIPRGGVPVAYEIATALGAPLDVLVVRKIGAPGNPEFGVGAIAEGGIQVLSPPALAAARASPADVAPTIAREEQELERRLVAYRPGRALADVQGRTVVLVDDGLATGITAVAAVRALRRLGAAHVVLAVPVAAPESVVALRQEADDVVAAEVPARLGGIGSWYDDFTQTTDEEVLRLLGDPAVRPSPPPPP